MAHSCRADEAAATAPHSPFSSGSICTSGTSQTDRKKAGSFSRTNKTGRDIRKYFAVCALPHGVSQPRYGSWISGHGFHSTQRSPVQSRLDRNTAGALRRLYSGSVQLCRVAARAQRNDELVGEFSRRECSTPMTKQQCWYFCWYMPIRNWPRAVKAGRYGSRVVGIYPTTRLIRSHRFRLF